MSDVAKQVERVLDTNYDPNTLPHAAVLLVEAMNDEQRRTFAEQLHAESETAAEIVCGELEDILDG